MKITFPVKFISGLIFLGLASCSGKGTFADIEPGTSSKKVIEIMGEPDVSTSWLLPYTKENGKKVKRIFSAYHYSKDTVIFIHDKEDEVYLIETQFRKNRLKYK